MLRITHWVRHSSFFSPYVGSPPSRFTTPISHNQPQTPGHHAETRRGHAQDLAVGLEKQALGRGRIHTGGTHYAHLRVGDVAAIVHPGHVAHQVDPAQVSQDNYVEPAVGQASVGRYLHTAAKVLAVGDHQAV